MSVTDVPGVRVGHWDDARALTGCTVILPPPGTNGSAYVAGGASGTREIESLQPGTLVQEVTAVVLSGGSSFGLAAADGVMRWSEEHGLGFATTAGVVPIVPTAILFDLHIGDASVRPDAASGYAACEAAGDDRREGNVGAGMGATVGKWAGSEWCSKGGLGLGDARAGDLIVGAVVAVNAIGDVYDEDGSMIAGARRAPDAASHEPLTATTIGCVVTNARLSKEQCHRVARMASGGLARTIRPVYTMFDGDTMFALATGAIEGDVNMAGMLAADAVADAVRRGVRAATSVEGAPALAHR